MAEANNQNAPAKPELMQFIEDGNVKELLFKENDQIVKKKIEDCKFLTEGYCGIYFSAHWCPPCRGFTPRLATKYKEEMQEKGFTIIFASWDSDEAAFNGYFGEMPWAAFPFECSDALKKSAALPNVNGIPTLYLFNKGELYETGGRAAVMQKEFPYKGPEPEPYYDVEQKIDGINENACVLLMMPNLDEEKRKEHAECLLEHATEQAALKWKREVYHFTVTEFGGEKIGDKLQQFTTVKDDKMVILWFKEGLYQEFDLPTKSEEVIEAVNSYLEALKGDKSVLKKLALPGR